MDQHGPVLRVGYEVQETKGLLVIGICLIFDVQPEGVLESDVYHMVGVVARLPPKADDALESVILEPAQLVVAWLRGAVDYARLNDSEVGDRGGAHRPRHRAGLPPRK